MNSLPTMESCRLPATWRPSYLAIGAVAAFAVALMLTWMLGTGYTRFLHAYLIGITFVTSIALGGLFFVILQHLTQSQWSVVVRRVAEALSAAIPWLFLLFVPVLILLAIGDSRLYAWNDAELRQTDSIIQGKAAYLNAPFFAMRTIAYFGVWTLLSRFFWRESVEQDASSDVAHTHRMQRWSGPAMMVFAISICFAGFDWLMSLDSHWFSSIFGIYFFSGAVVGFVAALTLLTLALERSGALAGLVTTEHYHDLGKWMFGFTFFWAYIAFSQYLLIWYANIPEETVWFQVRQNGGWQWVSLLLVFGHFALPFCGLMSRAAKRRRLVLAFWAAWLLVMHWVDLYWIVSPHAAPNNAGVSVVEFVATVGAVLFGAFAVLRVAGRNPVAPVGDPRLSESLSFHNA